METEWRSTHNPNWQESITQLLTCFVLFCLVLCVFKLMRTLTSATEALKITTNQNLPRLWWGSRLIMINGVVVLGSFAWSAAAVERDYGLFSDMMSKLTCLHSLLAGKDNIVFRFIIEFSSLRDFEPLGKYNNNNRSIYFYMRTFERWYILACVDWNLRNLVTEL
jgi:hypothetical protein